MRNSRLHATLTPYSNVSFLASFSFRPDVNTLLRSMIPFKHRRWMQDIKSWEINAVHGASFVSMLRGHGYTVQDNTTFKDFTRIVATPETKEFRVDYLGIARTRDDGSSYALGWYNNGWNLTFGVEVLRKYMGADPASATTLYGVLGVDANATPEVIKKAYKRLAIQWHPDVCKEPTAEAQFIAIKRAYNILSDPQLRGRYEKIGLGFQAKTTLPTSYGTKHNQPVVDNIDYIPRFRCGIFTGLVTQTLARCYEYTMIDDVADIIENGYIVVAYWDMEANKFVHVRKNNV